MGAERLAISPIAGCRHAEARRKAAMILPVRPALSAQHGLVSGSDHQSRSVFHSRPLASIRG
jgi:hypothetical protein